jgi:hypothetical protein
MMNLKKQFLQNLIDDPDREIIEVKCENNYDGREKVGDTITVISKYEKKTEIIETEYIQ